jgi:hypothetical protein
MMRGGKLDDLLEGKGLEDPVSLSLFASFFPSLPSFHLCVLAVTHLIYII